MHISIIKQSSKLLNQKYNYLYIKWNQAFPINNLREKNNNKKLNILQSFCSAENKLVRHKLDNLISSIYLTNLAVFTGNSRFILNFFKFTTEDDRLAIEIHIYVVIFTKRIVIKFKRLMSVFTFVIISYRRILQIFCMYS